MKEIFIVSRGEEIARISHDTKTKKTFAKTFEPIAEGESNRCNCLSITVHTLQQLKDADYKDKIVFYGLNIVNNMVGRLINAKKTVEAVKDDMPEGTNITEAIFKVFAKGVELSETEEGLWRDFLALDSHFENKVTFKRIAYCKVEDEDKASSWQLRLHNLAKSAWDRLPDVEAGEIEEEDAV